jgi:quinol monooxygenase YgiN
MFCVIYQFKVKPGMTQQFRDAWAALTEIIFASCNGLGSRLHEADDGTWIAYAQWPDRETWENPKPIPNQDARVRLTECLDGEVKVLFKMTVADDRLRHGNGEHQHTLL